MNYQQQEENWAALQELIERGFHDGFCENCETKLVKNEYILNDIGHYCSGSCAVQDSYLEDDHNYEAQQLGFSDY